MSQNVDWHRLTGQAGLTIDDLPEDLDVHMELIDGSLIVTPLGDFEHQSLVSIYTARLIGAQLPPDCLALAGVNVIVGDRTLVMPDVAVADKNFLVHGGLGVSPGGLRLAVEITSPSTRRHDLTIKRELYQEWGVPLLIIDRSATPYRRLHNTLPDFAQALLTR